MEAVLDILASSVKILAALIPAAFGIIKWLIERKKKDEMKEMYERLLSERETRIEELLKKKKKLEKIIGK